MEQVKQFLEDFVQNVKKNLNEDKSLIDNESMFEWLEENGQV